MVDVTGGVGRSGAAGRRGAAFTLGWPRVHPDHVYALKFGDPTSAAPVNSLLLVSAMSGSIGLVARPRHRPADFYRKHQRSWL